MRQMALLLALAAAATLVACGSSDDAGSNAANDAVDGSGGAGGGDSGSGGAGEGPAPEPCPGGGLSAGDHVVDLSHAGVDYPGNLLHVPPSYDGNERTPLVLNWHGLTSNAVQQQAFSNMNPDADAAGYIVVYPNSPTNSWDGGACCNAGPRDDVGFARALVAELETQLCIDPRRIYSTGMSNGGFMSHRLACEAADLVAAVAPVSSVNGMDQCNPSRAIPLIQFNGTADPLIAYEGTAGGFPSVADTTAGWVERNSCDPTPEIAIDMGTTRCERFIGCDDGVEVIQCTHEGMGHCWPGTDFCPFGSPNTDISANEEMLALFDRFSLP